RKECAPRLTAIPCSMRKARVHQAVIAGNALQQKPYKYGGGHRSTEDDGYDCSGAVSYVLNKAGLLKGTTTSKGLTTYGKPGPGKWITIYAKPGHAFLVIGGLRLDTGGGKKDTGPRWKPGKRKTDGFLLRHPPGF
ncbi:MAG: peptidoglycan endopeptidase, partial [Verrucomicrobiota bacterium]